jgi:hypothetical protein
MAPSLKKALKAFIDEIPESKLENFPSNAGTLFTDDNFRLDLQGVSMVLLRSLSCPNRARKLPRQLTKTAHNLQIQANKNAPNTSVKKAAPASVAAVLVEFTSKVTAKEVREAFHKSAEEGKKVTI